MHNLISLILLLTLLSITSISYSFQKEQSVVLILKESQKLQENSNEFQTVINEHMRNLGKLNDQGVVKNVAGIEGGGELVFMNIMDSKNANEVIQQDPAIKESLYTYEVLGFDFQKGGLCDPSIPFETSAYDLILISFKNEIANLKTGVNSENLTWYNQKIRDIIQLDDVIMAGQFLNGEGDMILLNRNTQKQNIVDQFIEDNDFLQIELLTLWVNKGSFCEVE